MNTFKKISAVLICMMMILTTCPTNIIASSSSDNGNGTFTNPVLYADVPDCSVIRVGNTYYMASTTMHMSPGVPIMKSTDLVNWEIVNYVYDRICENNEANLAGGKDMYGKGSWAASLKYNAGTYYCSFMSYTSGKTYIYQTKDIENGSWTKYEINGCYHDMSLLFDSDGRVYMLYGSGDIKFVELTADCTGIKWGGASGTLFKGSNLVGNSLFEGTQAIKVNGYYYVFNISWPAGKPRLQYCSRSKSLYGPWEHKVVLETVFDNVAGVAQGGIVDTPDGKWYGLLFQDHGAVGRVPVLVPVSWQNGWPIMGNDGRSVSKTMAKPNNNSTEKTIVKSDEFDGKSAGKAWKNGLALVWQWNHNPDNTSWSITQRPGYLRLKNGSTANQLTRAKNILTQRTYGPTCSGKIAMDVTNMKNGDVAGLTAFTYKYGYIGVKMVNGAKKIVMVNAQNNSIPSEIASVDLRSDRVYLKVDCNFNTSKADFYYSTDSKTWLKLGNTLGMSYGLEHFMGYRFGLFNYATQQTGGYVDFDYFRVSDQLKGACVESGDVDVPVEPTKTPVVSTSPAGTVKDGWYYIKNVNANKYLQVKGDTAAAGQNVEIGTGTGVDGQKWYVTNTNDGAITLKTALGDFGIDIANGSAEDGANVQLYHYYGGDAQKYVLQATNTANIYTIATIASGKTKNFDVYEASKADGANVCQWTYNGNGNQQWVFEAVNSTPATSKAPTPTPTSSPTATPAPTPTNTPVPPTKTPEPTQGGATTGVTFDYKVVSDWGSSFQGEVVVTNKSGSDINGWTLTFDYNSKIGNLWGAEFVGQTGKTVTVKNPSWDAVLKNGSSVTIDFIADGTDKSAPVNFALK